MASPKSSSSYVKSLASFSKDDLGDSKGKIVMASLGRSGWGKASATEFLTRVIGIEKVSLPNFTSRSSDDCVLVKSFSRGCPIMMLKP